jgi:glucan phosphoethanolaminetransferase (alkaline phosphatase superfamily)
VFTTGIKEHEEIAKQCFWLNIINFMTLFKLAEIRLINPRLLKQLDRFAIWQSLMTVSFIEISGVRLSQVMIYHQILRHANAPPSHSMLNSALSLFT